jgi:hypothetical protein
MQQNGTKYAQKILTLYIQKMWKTRAKRHLQPSWRSHDAKPKNALRAK